MQQCFYALVVQAAAWMAIAVYADNVRPDKHGVRRPLWYPLQMCYWGGALRCIKALLGLQSAGSACGGAVALTEGGAAGTGVARRPVQRTPFASSEAARKVARCMSDPRAEELVIRCSSNPGSGALDAAGARGGGGVVVADPAASVASSHRHSVSSGFLRRREHRASSAAGEAAPGGGGVRNTTGGGAADLVGSTGGGATAATGGGGAAGSAAAAPRLHGLPSTLGRVPPPPPPPPLQHSTQLLVQNSVTVLRLSDASSGEPGIAAGTGGGAAAVSCGAVMPAGTTMTLAQYQALQAAAAADASASRRPWWESLLWRLSRRAPAEGAPGPAFANKHNNNKRGSVLSAGGGTGTGVSCGGGPGQQQHMLSTAKDGGVARPGVPGSYGMVPVVLDPGVLQEEQRMKALWYSQSGALWFEFNAAAL